MPQQPQTFRQRRHEGNHPMNFEIPADIVAKLAELDAFIAANEGA